MLKYLPILCFYGLFLMACGGDSTENTTASGNTTTTTKAAATDRIETKEQMKELVIYASIIQRRVFNMPSDKSLSYTIGSSAFNMELYREENGDTLAVVKNGALGKFGEFDRYVFYKNNRPIVMLVDQLKMDISKQMFTQIYTFYNAAGEVQPSAMLRGAERKEEMLAKGFVAKDLGETHNIRQYVQEYDDAVEQEGDYSLYFDEFLTEGGQSYLRFKVADEPNAKRYYVTALRLPADYKKDATLAKVEKNALLYQNKRVDVEWEVIKEETGALVPQWISSTFE